MTEWSGWSSAQWAAHYAAGAETAPQDAWSADDWVHYYTGQSIGERLSQIPGRVVQAAQSAEQTAERGLRTAIEWPGRAASAVESRVERAAREAKAFAEEEADKFKWPILAGIGLVVAVALTQHK
jgi:hypothetical protein